MQTVAILPPPQDEKTESVTLRVPAPLFEELEAVAEEEGYSRTALYLHFLRGGLEGYREEAARKAALPKTKK